MESTMNRRDLIVAGLAGGAALSSPALLRADDRYPSRPIELVVGFAAGGGTDTTARTLARYLEAELGGPVIVANRPGASGELALSGIARAAPDGYTLGITNYPGLLSIPIERKVPFRLEDFELLANIVSDPSAFSVAAAGNINTIDELVARAKAQPNAVTFGSTGVGTDEHLALSLFEQFSGAKLSHVPYRAGPLGTDLLGRHIEVAGLNVGEAVPLGDKIKILVQGGREAIAVRARCADLPGGGLPLRDAVRARRYRAARPARGSVATPGGGDRSRGDEARFRASDREPIYGALLSSGCAVGRTPPTGGRAVAPALEGPALVQHLTSRRKTHELLWTGSLAACSDYAKRGEQEPGSLAAPRTNKDKREDDQ